MVSKPVAEHWLDVILDLVPNLSVGVTHTQVLRLLLDLIHFTPDIVLFPVVTNDALQGIRVLDPFDQASVPTQRHNCVGS